MQDNDTRPTLTPSALFWYTYAKHQQTKDSSMFTYSQWLSDLFKAAGHKYIKRVPYMSGGKRRYRYIYNVTHMAGGKHVLDPEHMIVGAAFQVEAGAGKEVHAHIVSTSGDKVTYKLDDGPDKGKLVTESKSKLAERLNAEHGVHEALAGAREKQAKVVADLRARGASDKHVAREQARLDRLEAAAPAPKSEEPKSEESKTEVHDPQVMEDRAVQDGLRALAAKDEQALVDVFERAYMAPLASVADVFGIKGKTYDLAVKHAEELTQRSKRYKVTRRDVEDKIREGISDSVQRAISAMDSAQNSASFRIAEAVSLGNDPQSAEIYRDAFAENASARSILESSDITQTPELRGRGKMDVSAVARKVLESAVRHVSRDLIKQRDAHERAIKNAQGANAQVEEYARYALDTGAASMSGIAAEYVDNSEARRKGEPLLVGVLRDTVSDINRLLTNESALARAIVDALKEQANERSYGHTKKINANLAALTDALDALA